MIATDAPILPPLYELHDPGAAHPLEAARARAAELGAGALFLAERPGLLAWAVVLEPEEPLAAARRAFPVAMAAAADALAAHCLPERSVAIGWPDILACDTGRIGGGRLAWPDAAAETAPPDWLVFAVDLIADRDDLAEPGRFPESTSLREEHFEEPRAIVESFARNLMLRLDIWAADGFDAAAADYLRRLEDQAPGTGRRIGPTGDLLVREADGRVHARSLRAALAAPGWWDVSRGGPRL